MDNPNDPAEGADPVANLADAMGEALSKFFEDEDFTSALLVLMEEVLVEDLEATPNEDLAEMRSLIADELRGIAGRIERFAPSPPPIQH